MGLSKAGVAIFGFLVTVVIMMTPGSPAFADDAGKTPEELDYRPLVLTTDAVLRQQLCGRWQTLVGKAVVELALNNDGTFKMGDMSGAYLIFGGELVLTGQGTGTACYQISLDKQTLTLSGSKLKSAMKFDRMHESVDYLGWLFDMSWDSAKLKLYRILVILAVLITCRIVIAMLRGFSHFIIYSHSGPMKFLYPNRKNRAMTIHMLTLNVVKYLIYLLAIGFILTEMGVNYAAYLASISLLGLSIAFGAQGLVKDMVTGLLIIIEGQFDVGDMVDIPPHTGVVEVLGLRMTKLRNYEGQQIVIPNGAISAVCNYSDGDQDASVDVCVPDEQTAAKAAKLLDSLGGQLAQQYPGVIIKAPRVTDCLQIDSKFIVRMHIGFWPNQKWIIDQQLVVRIKAAMQDAEIELADSAISVFYHDAKHVEVSTFGDKLEAVSQKIASLGKSFQG